MPNVVERNSPQEDPIVSKVRRLAALKGFIADSTAEKNTVQSELTSVIEEHGISDEKGHLHLELPQEVSGVSSLQLQRRVSQKLDPNVAEKILKDKGLDSRCYTLVPVLNESEVMACYYEDLLTEEDIDTMFVNNVTYAFLMSKS